MDTKLLEDIVMSAPLDIGAIPSARGRRPSQLILEVLRPLTEADKELLLNPPAKGITTTPLAKLRSTHHMLARLLAQGTKPGECSAITGYSPSRVSILQNDPAFKELVEYYKTQVEAKYLDVHERLATLGMSTVEELQERLESDPLAFTNKELMALAELLLDRSCAPPKGQKPGGSGGTVVPSITVNFVQPQNQEHPMIELNPKSGSES